MPHFPPFVLSASFILFLQPRPFQLQIPSITQLISQIPVWPDAPVVEYPVWPVEPMVESVPYVLLEPAAVRESVPVWTPVPGVPAVLALRSKPWPVVPTPEPRPVAGPLP